MKTLSALLLIALGFAPAAFAADTKPAAKPAPAAKEAAAGDTLDEKNLVGILITRKSGGFINLKIDGGKFTMDFFDADKKATSPDVAQATIRFRKGKSTHRYLLTGSGKSLVSPLPIDRPYIFNAAHVVLFDNDEDTPAEAYTVNFKQPMPGDGEGTPVDEMTPEQLQKIKK